jgi:hypothetical protein
MKNSLKAQSTKAIPAIRPFFSRPQLSGMVSACYGEEGDFFMQKIIDIEKLIASMPVTYEQDGAGDDAVVYLHYFHGSSDWFVTEKDVDGGVTQAFGYSVLNGDVDFAELGYISIAELTCCGVEFDLYFTPSKLGVIKQQLAAKA